MHVRAKMCVCVRDIGDDLGFLFCLVGRAYFNTGEKRGACNILVKKLCLCILCLFHVACAYRHKFITANSFPQLRMQLCYV